MEVNEKEYQEFLNWRKGYQEFLEWAKKQKKVWKPERGEDYFCIRDIGCCGIEAFWESDDGYYEHQNRYEIGNCFKTQEEAKFMIKKLKVIAELKRFASEHNEPINWEDTNTDKWYISFDYEYYKIYYCVTNFIKLNTIYFSSEEIAKQAIETIGEDRIKKYYLGVE